MEIFVSWSGPTSHAAALALRSWLPAVIQQVDCYVSSEDIAKGAQWVVDLSETLARTGEGIICVTRANQHAPWLNYEAGVLARATGARAVRTLLLGVPPAQVTGPLSTFQHTSAGSRDDVHRFVRSINTRCARPVADAVLDRAFAREWPSLHADLGAALARDTEAGAHSGRSAEVMLEELLDLSRGIGRQLSRSSRGLSAPLDETRQPPPRFLGIAGQEVERQFRRLPPGTPITFRGRAGTVTGHVQDGYLSLLGLRFDDEDPGADRSLYACFGSLLEEQPPL